MGWCSEQIFPIKLLSLRNIFAIFYFMKSSNVFYTHFNYDDEKLKSCYNWWWCSWWTEKNGRENVHVTLVIHKRFTEEGALLCGGCRQKLFLLQILFEFVHSPAFYCPLHYEQFLSALYEQREKSLKLFFKCKWEKETDIFTRLAVSF